MQTKKIINSKTIWFNVLSVLAIVITQIMATPELKEMLGGYASLLMIAGATINGILRFFTEEPLKPLVKPKPTNPVDAALREDDLKDF